MEKDRGFLKHEQSSAHNNAVQRYVNAPVENHVSEIISSNLTQLKRTSANNLLKIIYNIKFLGKKYSWDHKSKPQYIIKFFLTMIICFTVVSSDDGEDNESFSWNG